MKRPKAFRLEETLRQAVESGVCTALAFGVSKGEGPLHQWYYGRLSPDPSDTACDQDTRFDLASLTKPLTTTLWALRLVEKGALSLTAPIGEYVEVRDAGLSVTPVWRLLTHTAGLPAHRPYFRGLGRFEMDMATRKTAKASIRRMIANTPITSAAGNNEIYSDLSYLQLEEIAESVNVPLENCWEALPGHSAHQLHFNPLNGDEQDDRMYAATERCPWRRRLLRGEVHDDNCWTMGGVGGHAGLFGRLTDVHSLGLEWLRGLNGQTNSLGLSAALIKEATARSTMISSGTRVMGWDTPSPGVSTSGQHFGRRSVGHLGFTGTSIWIDPDAEVVMVLLTNRVCPTRANLGIRTLRPIAHNLAWAWLHQ